MSDAPPLTPAQAAEFLRKIKRDLPQSSYVPQCLELWATLYGSQYVSQVRRELSSA